MKFKFLSTFFAVLFVTGAVFAQSLNVGGVRITNDSLTTNSDRGSVMINDDSVSVTSDRGSVVIDNDGVAIDTNNTQGNCTVNGKTVPCDQMEEMVGGALSGILGFGFIILILSFIVCVAGFIFWIVTLVHALTKPIENKGMWVVVMVFTGALGSLIYYFVEMRPFNKKMMAAYKTQNPVTPTQSEIK